MPWRELWDYSNQDFVDRFAQYIRIGIPIRSPTRLHLDGRRTQGPRLGEVQEEDHPLVIIDPLFCFLFIFPLECTAQF